MLCSRMLLLVKRGLYNSLPLFIVYIIIVFFKIVFKKKNYVLQNIVFAVLLIIFLWVECFSWHPLRPLALIYSSKTQFGMFRTENNQKIYPEQYTWYPIQAKGNNSIIQSVVNEYIEGSGTFDFDTYSYFATFGFTMIDLYANYYFKNSSECIAIHGYDCDPDQVLIYRIPKADVWPGEDRSNQSLYIFE